MLWYELEGAYFDLHINGLDVTPEVRESVLSVSVNQDVKGATSCSLMLDDWDDDRQTYRFSQRRLVREGNTLTIFFGYAGGPRQCMGRFELTEPTHRWQKGSRATYEIRGMDPIWRLNKNIMPRVIRDKNSTFSQVIKKIGADYGLDVSQVRDTPTKITKQVFKSRIQNDWNLLNQLCLAAGLAEPYIRHDPVTRKDRLIATRDRFDIVAGHYILEQTAQGETTRGHVPLDDFQSSWSLADMPTEIEITGYDKKTGKSFNTIVKYNLDHKQPDPIGIETNKDKKLHGYLKKFGGLVLKMIKVQQWDRKKARWNRKTLRTYKIDTKQTAIEFARSYFKVRERNYLYASFACPGIPDLLTHDIVEVIGSQGDVDGMFRVHQIEHTIEGGSRYTCKGQLSALVQAESETQISPVVAEGA